MGLFFAGNSVAISGRLLANNAGLDAVFVIAPGAEIINRRQLDARHGEVDCECGLGIVDVPIWRQNRFPAC